MPTSTYIGTGLFTSNGNNIVTTTTYPAYQNTVQPQISNQTLQISNQTLQQQPSVYYRTVTFLVIPPWTLSDSVKDSLSKLQAALEQRSLDNLTSGLILGWMARNSHRHQQKIERVARAIRASTGRIREFLATWEPGKKEG